MRQVDPSVVLLLWGVGIVGLLIGLEIAAIAFFKFERERREAIESATRNGIIESLIEALDGQGVIAIPPPRGLVGRATREAVIGMIATISGDARQNLVELLERAGYIDWVAQHLGSRNAATRARGCMILGGMHSQTANARLLDRFYNDTDADVRLTAAEALAQIGSAPTAAILIEAVRRSSNWQRLRVANAISRMGVAAVPALLDSLGESDEAILRLSLDVLCDIGVVPQLLPVIRLLSHASPEIRGRAVDLLGIAGAVDAMAHVMNRAGDSVWFVRVRAIKSMQRLGIPDDSSIAKRYYEVLERALHDPAWWVRQHGAEALASAGDRGRSVLEASSSDAAAAALQMFTLREGAR